MTEPSSADAGAGAEALLGLAAGRPVRLPPTVSDAPPSSSTTSAQPPPFLPPVDRLPALSEWRVEPFPPPLPPPLLEPPPPTDALRPSPWPSHQYAYPWHVGYAYPPSQLYYYPQPLPYQRQPLAVPPPPVVPSDVPPLRSLTSPLDKLRPLADRDPVLRPPTADGDSAAVQPTPSHALPPSRARGALAELINPTDTVPGAENHQPTPSHLSQALQPVSSAPDTSTKSSLAILVEASNEIPPSSTPEKPALQTEPSDASTVLHHNTSQSTCARPSPPQLVTPLRLPHNHRGNIAKKEHQKSLLAGNTLRPLEVQPNHDARNGESRDVTHLNAKLEPVSKQSVSVATPQSPSLLEKENTAVHAHSASAPRRSQLARGALDQPICVSFPATTVADGRAITSSEWVAEADKMHHTDRTDDLQSTKTNQGHVVDPYSDKSSDRNSDQQRRINTEECSKYHTPRARASRDANRTVGRGSRRSTKTRGRRSRRRPISINDLDSEDNHDHVHGSESDGGVASVVDEDEDGNSSSEETRCPCGSKENSGIMIACDQCNTWQHGKCMGFRRNNELPEHYFCNVCRPDQMRPNCIAHPKFKERYGRDREGKEYRAGEAESLMASIRPAELRKLFMSDLRNRKSAGRTRSDVVVRYASLFKTQYPKSRQSIVDGLSVILELNKAEVGERFESALKRLRTEKPQDDGFDRKRSSVAHEADHAEPSQRSAGNGRTQGQKRARSNVTDAAEGNTARQDSGHIESVVEIDPHCDSRGMSREERKLQQTMKLFARMEERERERKRPRTHEAGSSPRTSPVGRPKASRAGSQVRGNASKSSLSPSGTGNEEPGENPAVADARQQCRASEPKQKRKLADPNVLATSESRQTEKPHSLQYQSFEAEQLVLTHKSSSTSHISGDLARDASRRERDSRSRDRIEKSAINRKDSVSPESHNVGSRRRKHFLTERARSNEVKRRRTGPLKDVERRFSAGKDSPEPEKALDFQLYVPGPSVLGSKSIVRERLSVVERGPVAEEEFNADKEKNEEVKPNRKEWLLKRERKIAQNKSVGLDLENSPAKKRLLTERRIEEIEKQESRANDVTETDDTIPARVPPTLSVSMIVVSQKESLPDNGQILESTRLVLREEKEEGKIKKEKEVDIAHALKKRPIMFVGARGNAESEEVISKSSDPCSDEAGERSLIESNERVPHTSSPTARLSSAPKPVSDPPENKSSKPSTPPLRVPSPKVSTPKHTSTSVLPATVATVMAASPRRKSPVASPKLRSSPLPSFRSAIRTTTKSSHHESRSPSPPITNEKMDLPGERQPIKLTTGSQNSRFKSSSPSPERQGTSKTSPSGTSNPSEGSTTVQKKLDVGNTESEKASPESLTKTAAQTTYPSREEIVMSENKSGDLGGEPAPAAASPKMTSRSPAPPVNALRSIRSMPVADIRKASSGQNTSNACSDVQKTKSNGAAEPSKMDIPSSGATISDVFQRRLEGFWKPAAKTPLKPPPKPSSAPPPSFSIKGSTAKLGAALPLSCKPNLDTLRNSTGLSPRVSSMSNGYHQGSGRSFRSKSMDYDRPRNSLPSFSQSKRSHSYSHGRGYPRSSSHNMNSGKPNYYDDRRRFGRGRDSSHHSRDDDKGKNGGTPTQLWSRSYAYRNSRPSMSDDHDRSLHRRPGDGPMDPDGLRRGRKPLQDSWVPMGGPRQNLGFQGMNGGSNRRMNGDSYGRGSRRGHSHEG